MTFHVNTRRAREIANSFCVSILVPITYSYQRFAVALSDNDARLELL